MLLSGNLETVASEKVEAGRFYIRKSENTAESLFFCFSLGKDVRGEPQNLALFFHPKEPQQMSVREIRPWETLIELGAPRLRVDPRSIHKTNRTDDVVEGSTLILAGDDPLAVVPFGYRRYPLISLETGEPIDLHPSASWVCFAKWELVFGNDNENLTLVSFDGYN